MLQNAVITIHFNKKHASKAHRKEYLANFAPTNNHKQFYLLKTMIRYEKSYPITSCFIDVESFSAESKRRGNHPRQILECHYGATIRR